MRYLVLIVTALAVSAMLPADAGSDSSELIALPLMDEAPAWWTPDVIAATDQAAAVGAFYDPLAGEPVPAGGPPGGGVPVAPDYLFIRPGALFLSSSGSLCTYNFVYNGGAQIGTAGHCVGGVGQAVYIVAVPSAPLVTRLGTVASFRNGGIGNDWALINIDPQWALYVDPNMAYLGGPSCSAWTPSASPVKHVGHGIQTGLVASVPRVSEVTSVAATSFQALGEVSGGDSGSPVVKVDTSLACSGGSAAGVVTHCGSVTGLDCVPIFWGTDIRSVPATVTPGLDPL